ncbi:endonuclease NucS domain-containing protein [Paraburkholderia aspalathi]|uniref:endonuclease NucS domain-containing protein n=1 Tax=Paraburkholderia aspalathi TaxID=1324617 RepID=UPI0038B7C0C4
MTIRSALWKVSAQPEPLSESLLASERLLEDMIVAAPNLLSDEWMLIGRQEDTGFGGRIDLLAIAPDGTLVLIEIKRDRTPREVVAQALDYASWVQTLHADDVAAIYGRFAPGRSLAADFQQRFGLKLDEDTINESHQIVVVAGSLDESSERIITYLNERSIAINVLCFQVFKHGDEQIISRAWLNDPLVAQAAASTAPSGPTEPWNGEFYHSYGVSGTRSWDDAVEYGFICGGGKAWYSRTLRQLNPGDRVWVNVPGSGYVGVGRVTGHAQSARDFKVSTSNGEKPVLEAARRGTYHAEFVDDPDRSEYFVPVHWLQTVPLRDAVQEIGLFGNQNTVCRPTTPKWRNTVERLKERFTSFGN